MGGEDGLIEEHFQAADFEILLRDMGFERHEDVSCCILIVNYSESGLFQADPITFAQFAEFLQFYRTHDKMSVDNLLKLKAFVKKTVNERMSRRASLNGGEDDIDESDDYLSEFETRHRPRAAVKLAVSYIYIFRMIFSNESKRCSPDRLPFENMLWN